MVVFKFLTEGREIAAVAFELILNMLLKLLKHFKSVKQKWNSFSFSNQWAFNLTKVWDRPIDGSSFEFSLTILLEALQMINYERVRMI